LQMGNDTAAIISPQMGNSAAAIDSLQMANNTGAVNSSLIGNNTAAINYLPMVNNSSAAQTEASGNTRGSLMALENGAGQSLAYPAIATTNTLSTSLQGGSSGIGQAMSSSQMGISSSTMTVEESGGRESRVSLEGGAGQLLGNKDSGNTLAYRFGRFDVLPPSKSYSIPTKVINAKEKASGELD